MSDYPYVPAWFDGYGSRKGPTLGLALHMAEGGGTVGYLDKKGNPPSRGVSVHAVCEYSGRVVRMLPWGDASGSMNPADRSTDKAYFGHSHLVDVLGDWWTNPNAAVISIEIEGFAKAGPNADQVAAVITWGLDMRVRYPSLRGAIGHADQTDTKGCPGSTVAMRTVFAGIGGHGLWQEEHVNLSKAIYLRGAKVEGGRGIFKTAEADSADLIRNTVAGETLPLVGNTGTGWQVVDPSPTLGPAGYIRDDVVTEFVDIPPPPGPTPDCTAAVKAATDPLKAEIVIKDKRVADYAERLHKINGLSAV